MNNITLNLIEAEKKAKDITIKNHSEEFELITTMLNLYTNGFSLLPSLNDKDSDTDWLWLFLITRSFFSIRCAVELMTKAYYAQAMTLMRIVTEAYFLCGNCEKDRTIIDTLRYNKPNSPFNYYSLAEKMYASDIHDRYYKFECKFSHASSLGLGIMTTETNPRNRELKPVPFYAEILFITCCQFALKNGLLMADFLGKLLDDLSKEKVKAWRIKAKIGEQQVQEWLGGLETRYGNR